MNAPAEPDPEGMATRAASALRAHTAPLVLTAAVLACALATLRWPGPMADVQVGWILQASAQALAAVACWRAAGVSGGRGRTAWLMLGAGQAIWCVTDVTYAAVGLAGMTVPEVSGFDAAWLAYYLPTLGAVAVIYAIMQPEPGWLGVMDAVVLAGAGTLVLWAGVVGPLAASGAGSTAGTAVNTLYPALDLLGLCVVAWLVVRRRATPRWTLGLVGFFGLGVVGGVLYLDSALSGGTTAAVMSGVAYSASSACLLGAAQVRRRGGAAAAATATIATIPPAWSQLLPPAAVLPLAVILAGDPSAVVRGLCLLVILVVIVRLSWSLLVLARLGQAHEALLRRDALTGAHNRLFLAEELGRLVARAQRSGEPLAVVALDLDGFKELNDTRGHATGDAFLIRLVSEMRVRLRAGDVLCRQGGDEFLVLLPDTDERGALRLAGRMLDAVTATRAAIGGATRVDGSLGVVALAGGEAEGRVLLDRADAAMYAAKWSGGGRVLAWRDRLAATGAPVVVQGLVH